MSFLKRLWNKICFWRSNKKQAKKVAKVVPSAKEKVKEESKKLQRRKVKNIYKV